MSSWYFALRTDGRKFGSVHQARYKDKRYPQLAVGAGTVTDPRVCDGAEVCVHLFHSCGRSPMRPIFSVATQEEARTLASLLRRCCWAWEQEGLSDEDEIDKRLKTIARRLGYVADHHSVWHKSPAWLDTPSYGSEIWRDTDIGKEALKIWKEQS